MWIRMVIAGFLIPASMSALAYSQDARSVLERAATVMGVTNLKTLEYSGTGAMYSFGQAATPYERGPRINYKSNTRLINYETPAIREESVRVEGENPLRGGAEQPLRGEARSRQVVSPRQVLFTPHGFVRQALKAQNASVKSETIDGKKY